MFSCILAYASSTCLLSFCWRAAGEAEIYCCLTNQSCLLLIWKRGNGPLRKCRQKTVDLRETMLVLLLRTNVNKYRANCELGFSYFREGECPEQKPHITFTPLIFNATWWTLTTKITQKTKRFRSVQPPPSVMCSRQVHHHNTPLNR